jgi:tRNA(Ile)-lysidine synthase
VLTAHTLDDQAETVLLRLARGSGPTGLAAMARSVRLHVPSGSQAARQGEMQLLRPLLEIPKARLVATLTAEGIAFAEDPSNADPRFTRARLRALMPALAGEGLNAVRLARLAARLRRAEATIELAVDVAAAALSLAPWSEKHGVVLDAEKFRRLPDEVALRLLGRAIALVGHEGPVQLGKLEMLYAALVPDVPSARIRRTLAGAVITYAEDRMTIERAPPRRIRGRLPASRKRSRTLTTRRYDRRNRSKRR